jgi:hypothetical protein
MSWFTKMLGLDKLTNKNPEIKRAIDSVTKPVNDQLKAEAKELFDGYLYDQFIGFFNRNHIPITVANDLLKEYPTWRDDMLAKLFK